MRNLVEKIKDDIIVFPSWVKEKISENKGEVGVGTVLGVVVTLIIFAFVVVPESRAFASDLFTEMRAWYSGLNIFPTS